MRKIVCLCIFILLLSGCQKSNGSIEKGPQPNKEETISELQKQFQSYYEVNEDVIGFLQIDHTDIAYPVMNSDEYIYQGIDYQYSKDGLPFVSNIDLSENIIIYGHNAYSNPDAPFHDLRNYIDEVNWQTDYDTIQFYNKEMGLQRYVIFAICRLPAEDENIQYYKLVNYQSESDYYLLMSLVRQYQQYENLNSLPTYNQRILVISTCANCKKYPRDPNQRIVIFAKQVQIQE